MKANSYFLFVFLVLSGCQSKPELRSDVIAFTGATIIDGTVAAPIADGVLLISNGKVTHVGSKSTISIPDGAEVRDVAGKYIIPGLINAHGHVGEVKGIEGGHYSRANVLD